MTIAERQQALLDAGWQFQEHCWPDVDSYVQVSASDDPTIFDSDPERCVGWGRFPRQVCWEKAYAYCLEGKRRSA